MLAATTALHCCHNCMTIRKIIALSQSTVNNEQCELNILPVTHFDLNEILDD